MTEATGATGAMAALEARFRRIGVLEEVAGVLDWDTATLMPSGGAVARAEQRATLQVLGHEILVAPETADLLEQAVAAPGDAWRAANLREMRRRWLHASALPADLVAAMATDALRCEMAWREARPAADFARVLPELEHSLGLVREAAAAKGEALDRDPWDALHDGYEPGGSAASFEPLFDELAGFLPGLLERALERQAGEPAPLAPEGPFDAAGQSRLARRLMTALGFDFGHGRLDTSAHPFCGGVPGDLRITTRWDEAEFSSGLMGVLHETGHALYEAGLPADWRYQPVGQARGMSVHESQSLIMEMQACRSREFAGFVAPLLREAWDAEGPAWEAENLYRLGTRVGRSLIRVDADEVTYPLHIILRSRLERAMVAGDLVPGDLPGAWNDGMAELLGVVPPDDGAGCLQDIHWYCGAWGYFPCYTLGAITAAQLFRAAREATPGLLAAIGRGDFAPLLGWLRERVHGQGSLPERAALIREATGAAPGTADFRAHLEARYGG